MAKKKTVAYTKKVTISSVPPAKRKAVGATRKRVTKTAPVAAPTSHTISTTVAGGKGGRIEPTGTWQLEAGKNQTVKFIPEPEHRIKKVLVDGFDRGPIPAFDITNAQANAVIEVEFEAVVPPTPPPPPVVNHTITIKASTGGTVLPDSPITVPHGGKQQIRVKPEPGYRPKSLIVDGKDMGLQTVFMLSNVRGDQEVEAIFEPIPAPKKKFTWAWLPSFRTIVGLAALLIIALVLWHYRGAIKSWWTATKPSINQLVDGGESKGDDVQKPDSSGKVDKVSGDKPLPPAAAPLLPVFIKADGPGFTADARVTAAEGVVVNIHSTQPPPELKVERVEVVKTETPTPTVQEVVLPLPPGANIINSGVLRKSIRVRTITGYDRYCGAGSSIAVFEKGPSGWFKAICQPKGGRPRYGELEAKEEDYFWICRQQFQDAVGGVINLSQ